MMRSAKKLTILVLLAVLGLPLALVRTACAQGIETDLTTHSVAIRADFAGAKIILFGSVVDDLKSTTASPPDVVVVVKGPKGRRNVQQKKRIAGIWINADRLPFNGVPGYYATIANRPVAQIAPTPTLRRLGIGLDSVVANLELSKLGSTNPEIERYAEAIARIMQANGLYSSYDQGVSFVGRHLFRAEFSLPSNVPIGDYRAIVYLLRDGRLVGRHATSLKIEKRGIERLIYSMAHEQPFLYGLLSVLAAVLAGLLAAAAFRSK